MLEGMECWRGGSVGGEGMLGGRECWRGGSVGGEGVLYVNAVKRTGRFTLADVGCVKRGCKRLKR